MIEDKIDKFLNEIIDDRIKFNKKIGLKDIKICCVCNFYSDKDGGYCYNDEMSKHYVTLMKGQLTNYDNIKSNSIIFKKCPVFKCSSCKFFQLNTKEVK